MDDQEVIKNAQQDIRSRMSRTSELIKENDGFYRKVFDLDKILITVIGLMFGVPYFTPNATDTLNFVPTILLLLSLGTLLFIIFLRLSEERKRLTFEFVNSNLWIFWSGELVRSIELQTGAIKDFRDSIESTKNDYAQKVYRTYFTVDYKNRSFDENKQGLEDAMKKIFYSEQWQFSLWFELVIFAIIVASIYLQVKGY